MGWPGSRGGEGRVITREGRPRGKNDCMAINLRSKIFMYMCCNLIGIILPPSPANCTLYSDSCL